MSDKLSFREAGEADLPVIIGMLVDDTLGKDREIATMPPADCYQSAFAALAADPNNHLILCVKDDEIAGCLQLTFIPGLSRKGMWRAQIESVRTSRKYRGQGIGRLLFDYAIEQARQRGCGLVQLTTDKVRTDAHRFYEALGFTASHDGMKLSL
ncbi:MAG: GNAT family N-acetyltransferase [Rhodospirillales bacterium]